MKLSELKEEYKGYIKKCNTCGVYRHTDDLTFCNHCYNLLCDECRKSAYSNAEFICICIPCYDKLSPSGYVLEQEY